MYCVLGKCLHHRVTATLHNPSDCLNIILLSSFNETIINNMFRENTNVIAISNIIHFICSKYLEYYIYELYFISYPILLCVGVFFVGVFCVCYLNHSPHNYNKINTFSPICIYSSVEEVPNDEAGKRLLTQFKSESGEVVGTPFDLPIDITVDKLQLICNAILQKVG